MRDERNVLSDLALGLAAGAAATYVMGKVNTLMYERESDEARKTEDAARGDRTAYESAAEKIAELAGWGLSADERRKLGKALHWALGVGTAAAYAVLRRRVRRIGALQGTVFGTGFWLLFDEIMLSLLRLTPGPMKFPWQTHARGLAGHVVYGAVTDTALGAAERILRRRRRRRRFSWR
jgi:hypothetical protein